MPGGPWLWHPRARRGGAEKRPRRGRSPAGREERAAPPKGARGQGEPARHGRGHRGARSAAEGDQTGSPAQAKGDPKTRRDGDRARIFTFASDIVEYLEQQLGQRYEGLVTSVSSIGSKVGTGLGSAILGWGLEVGGYDGALIQQAQSAKDAETFLLFIVPTLASVVCFIAMWFWDIDKKIKK